jgi:hypothetical protein
MAVTLQGLRKKPLSNANIIYLNHHTPLTATQMNATEKILYRFVATGTKTEFFELIFTPNRMIIAKTGGQPYLKFGEMLKAAEESKKKTAELQQLTPEQILADNPENVSITHSNITSIEMNRPGILGLGKIKIQIAGTNKRYEFRLALKKPEFQSHIDFLTSILKEKVIVK